MSPLRIAYLHLWRRRLSTVVVLLGIVLAVASSGLLLRLYKLTSERFATLIHTGDAIVGTKTGSVDLLLGLLNFEGPYPEFIPMNLFRTLKSQQSIHFEDKATVDSNFVREVFPFVLFAKAGDFRVYATDISFFDAKEEEWPELETGSAPRQLNEVVVGATVAEKLNLKVGDTLKANAWVTETPSEVTAQVYRVTGIFKRSHKAWDRIALANWDTAQKLFQENAVLFRTAWKTDVLHFMLFYLHPGGWPHLQSLINQRTVAQAVSVNAAFRQLDELTGAGRELGLFVAVIILVLGFSTVMSMMMSRFDSMNVQLAVLRALGYSKKDMALVLVYEALYLAAAGCVVGALVDALLFPWVRDLLGANVPSAEVVPMELWHSWPVWAAVILGNLLSVIYPIWRVSKQNIHTSLRNL